MKNLWNETNIQNKLRTKTKTRRPAKKDTRQNKKKNNGQKDRGTWGSLRGWARDPDRNSLGASAKSQSEASKSRLRLFSAKSTKSVAIHYSCFCVFSATDKSPPVFFIVRRWFHVLNFFFTTSMFFTTFETSWHPSDLQWTFRLHEVNFVPPFFLHCLSTCSWSITSNRSWKKNRC